VSNVSPGGRLSSDKRDNASQRTPHRHLPAHHDDRGLRMISQGRLSSEGVGDTDGSVFEHTSSTSSTGSVRRSGGTRTTSLATGHNPVDGTVIDLSLASQVREIRKPKRPVVGLGFLPPAARAPIMNRFLMPQQRYEVVQDVGIWSRKHYLSRPRLNRADGEIATFRDYCAQFYPEPCDGDA